MYTVLLSLLLAVPPAPDVLVVCPAEFRPALLAWEEYRRGQGYEILVVAPPGTAGELRATVHRIAQAGQLKYLLLVGDVPSNSRTTSGNTSVPTNYIPAKINTRWGSEPTIASDTPYADLDGDGVPDLAVGRIPADSAEELAAVVRKIIRYEAQAADGQSERRLNVVSGAGGFGVVMDALIEAAARQVFQQIVPPDCEMRHLSVHANSNAHPAPGEASNESGKNDIREAILQQLNEGSLAWIYMGHGLPTQLDNLPTATGDAAPILSVDDVPRLRCGSAQATAPLAVLIACYTGACDAPRDGLAEELSLAENGPIAVVAATRVTMPYGNTVFGHELLRACFQDRPTTLGEILRTAQTATLGESKPESLRASLDVLAQGFSQSPADLPAERGEHVLMYHLLGDPLLRLRIPQANVAQASGPAVK